MKISELIEHLQNLMAEHGDHDVWFPEHEGDAIPYRAEWFMFNTESLGDSPANVYTI